MTADFAAAVACESDDGFRAAFGAGRGLTSRVVRQRVPACPTTGNGRIVVARGRENIFGEPSPLWAVGWHDSAITFIFDEDLTAPAAWFLHCADGGSQQLALTEEPERAIPWEQVPEPLRERICLEAVSGNHTRPKISFERPLQVVAQP